MTPVANHCEQVVDTDSARLDHSNEETFEVDADHETICKIPSTESPRYHQVVLWIAGLVKKAIPDTSSANVRCRYAQQLQSFFMLTSDSGRRTTVHPLASTQSTN